MPHNDLVGHTTATAVAAGAQTTSSAAGAAGPVSRSRSSCRLPRVAVGAAGEALHKLLVGALLDDSRAVVHTPLQGVGRRVRKCGMVSGWGLLG